MVLTDFAKLYNFLTVLFRNHNEALGTRLPHRNSLLLQRGFRLPFKDMTITVIKRYISSAVNKILQLLTVKLCELNAPIVS